MKFLHAISFVSLSFAGLAFFSAAHAVTAEEVIKQKLQAAGRDIPVTVVRPSVVENIYEVELSSGEVFYSTADGGYLFSGDLYQVAPQGFKNITEEGRMLARAQQIQSLDEKELVIFPAEGEKKGQITVFTDVDCGYCRKLHQEVPELNKMGISVRYMAFPRAGLGSEVYRTMASVWCSDNRQDALTRAKQGEAIQSKDCKNPIAAQYQLGQKLGVNGTPAIFLDDGRLLPGYMPAARIATTLGLKL